MSTNTTAQAGWYAVGGGCERYWDGWAWTQLVRPVPPYLKPRRRPGLLACLADFHDLVATTPN
jgi:hypothetical protein